MPTILQGPGVKEWDAYPASSPPSSNLFPDSHLVLGGKNGAIQCTVLTLCLMLMVLETPSWAQ